MVTFDGINKLIILDDFVTQITAKSIYSLWKEWVLESDNAKYPPCFRVIGGDDIGGGIKVDGTYFLINNWKIRPYEGHHVLTLNGNLYVDGGGNPFVKTIGDFNVLINQVTSNIVNLVTVATGSGVTNQDKIDIIQGVKTEISPNFLELENKIDNLEVTVDLELLTETIYNSLKPDFNIIKGLVQHNFQLTEHEYDTNGNLIRAIIKLYNNSDDINNQINSFAQYIVNAQYDDSGKLIDYRVIE